jgi:hypothetical protein
MVLEDLASGRRIEASEQRGPLARGCRLDTSALEEAVGLALASLNPRTEVVLVNRFGKREAEGRGFRPLIAEAVALQIPVIVGLNQAHAEAWQVFCGGDGVRLEASLDAILAWIEASLSRDVRGKMRTVRNDAPMALDSRLVPRE